jgi:hypothetical protein
MDFECMDKTAVAHERNCYHNIKEALDGIGKGSSLMV